MKKNVLSKLLCSVLTVMLLCSSTIITKADNDTVRLSFLAMSDLHLDELFLQTRESNMVQFQKVLDATKGMNLDAFIGGGDYSSYGNKTYWYKTKAMVNKAGFYKTIWALGNHEYGILGLNLFTNRNFAIFSGESKPYFVTQIKGYYFIVLGAESGIVGTYGRMSNAEKCWFYKTLKAASKDANGKPIFVISHYDLDTGTMRKDIANEMSKYDNIFFLWGHMHDGEYTDMTLRQCIHPEGYFTAARMGSVHYYNNANADALIVSVYDDRVVLQMKRVSGKILNPDTVTVQLVK